MLWRSERPYSEISMTTKNYSLKDLKVQSPVFKLKATGEHEHRFRKLNLDDELWIETTFGMPVEKIFQQSQLKLSSLLRIYFRLLEDQSPFAKVTEELDDETGKMVPVPPWRLFMKCMQGSEVKAVADAFLALLVSSRGVQKAEEAAAEKKTAKAAGSVGPESSIPSKASMDGLPNTSGH